MRQVRNNNQLTGHIIFSIIDGQQIDVKATRIIDKELLR